MDAKILIGILIVGVILISGCVDDSGTNDQQEEEMVSLSDCEKTITTEEWNDCVVKAAASNYDVLICKEIKYPGDIGEEDRLKEDCVETVEAKMQGISICEKVSGSYYKDMCYYNFAVAKQGASICEKVSNSYYKDMCYYMVAAAKQDASLCEKVPDSDDKNSCMAVAKQDASLCEKISDSGWCYYNVAAAKQDASFCEKISDSDDKNRCYYNVAAAKQDASLCEKVSDLGYYNKDKCYDAINKQ